MNKSNIDFSFYTQKFGIPLLERKWIVIIFFLFAVVLALVLYFTVSPHYTSTATLLVEEPQSVMARVKDETVGPRQAHSSYVDSLTEKIKSASYASEVFNILPDSAKKDLHVEVGIAYQLRTIIKDNFYSLLGEERYNALISFLGIDTEIITRESQQLAELRKRIAIETKSRTGILWISATSTQRSIAPIITRSYVDVCIANNIEENKEVIRAERGFSQQRRDEALIKFREAEDRLIAFKLEYQMPSDLEVARDIKVQLQLERLKSDLAMAKERLDFINNVNFQNQMKEAGIVGNIKVINPSSIPLSASKKHIYGYMVFVIAFALAAAVFIILLADYIRGTVRHEKDITGLSDIPMLGTIPRIK